MWIFYENGFHPCERDKLEKEEKWMIAHSDERRSFNRNKSVEPWHNKFI